MASTSRTLRDNNGHGQKSTSPRPKANVPQFKPNTAKQVEKLCEITGFKLEVEELIVLDIYRSYHSEKGKFPLAANKYAVIRRGCIERGIEPFADDLIRNVLFKNKYPLNKKIDFTHAIKRWLGVPGNPVNEDECREALEWLCDELSKGAEGESRIIPRPLDVRNAHKKGTIVPVLGCVIPDYPTLNRLLGPGNWAEIIKKVLDATQREVLQFLPAVISIEDLIKDYQKAYEYFYGNYDKKDPHVLSREQIDAYGKISGVGIERYDYATKQERRLGNEIWLNDIRSGARLPIDPTVKNRMYNRKNIKWTQSEVYAGYMAAWNFKGRDQDPPTLEYLEDLSKRQSEIIKAQGKLATTVENRMVVPFTLVPNSQAIFRQFKSMVFFLGYVERVNKADGPLVFNDQSEKDFLTKSATTIVHRKPQKSEELLSKMPKAVAKIVRERLGMDLVNETENGSDIGVELPRGSGLVH